MGKWVQQMGHFGLHRQIELILLLHTVSFGSDKQEGREIGPTCSSNNWNHREGDDPLINNHHVLCDSNHLRITAFALSIEVYTIVLTFML